MSRFRADKQLAALLHGCALLAAAIALLILLFLVKESWPVLQHLALTRFVTDASWHPVFASSQAPAWEFGFGSSSFPSCEAGASRTGFPSWSLGTRVTSTTSPQVNDLIEAQYFVPVPR